MLTQPGTSPLRQVWYRWKSLKLPWRKRFLVGLDLQGNTFWEFRDSLASKPHRMRRIVQYPSTTPLSDVRVPPQWHQWLRYTRRLPPSIAELTDDERRRENLKVLIAAADRRWAKQGSYLDGPRERETDWVDTGHRHGSQAETQSQLQPQPPLQQHLHALPESEASKRWKHVRAIGNSEWQPQTWEGTVGNQRGSRDEEDERESEKER